MNQELPYDSYPDQKIKCSCGKETAIRWNGRQYVSDDPIWQYGIDEDDDMNSPLWFCGEPGHRGYSIEVRARDGFRLYQG